MSGDGARRHPRTPATRTRECCGRPRASYRVQVERSAPDAYTAQIKVMDDAATPHPDEELAPGVFDVVGELLLELTREGTG